MASIAGLGKIGLPRLSENMDPEDARALRNYLYQMQEQLQYVLCNLDTENSSEQPRGGHSRSLAQEETRANQRRRRPPPAG